jgi:hypothetical protein
VAGTVTRSPPTRGWTQGRRRIDEEAPIARDHCPVLTSDPGATWARIAPIWTSWRLRAPRDARASATRRPWYPTGVQRCSSSRIEPDQGQCARPAAGGLQRNGLWSLQNAACARPTWNRSHPCWSVPSRRLTAVENLSQPEPLRLTIGRGYRAHPTVLPHIVFVGCCRCAPSTYPIHLIRAKWDTPDRFPGAMS